MSLPYFPWKDCPQHTFILLVCVLMLSGCSPGYADAPTSAPANMARVYVPKPGQPTQQVSIIPTATYLPNAEIIQVALWVPPYLAETLAGALEEPLRGLRVSDASRANVRMEVGADNIVSQWVYALVTPFPSTLQGVSGDDLLSAWQGESTDITPLLMDSNTHDMLTALWGPSAGRNVQVLPQQELLSHAWAHQPSLAVVPFESLEPRWKVVAVDGLSPIRRDFDPVNYRLTVPVSLNGDPQTAALIRSNFVIPASNLDPHKMTVVAMTGVTALVRATASAMERRGILYPAQDIREWLLGADVTHISNEVPFAADCPQPNPTQEGVRFCSRDAYIQLLEDVGTDVVELTGDHFHDWGTDAMLHTLDLYRERGWRTYGGGADLAEGRKALLIEDQSNRIAFIGCNAKGGSFAQAATAHPGSAACDMKWMAAEISRLSGAGWLVIATFQHHEYYTYAAQPDQQRDFRQMAQAGAVIVSGSQAHQPQGMEFLGGSFIHYGLGNLFFDQYGLCEACRQGFIDRHVFYGGRYINTELLPIQFVDYARSRPMAIEEASDLLQALFAASGWK